jgi:hypothetical protein
MKALRRGGNTPTQVISQMVIAKALHLLRCQALHPSARFKHPARRAKLADGVLVAK